MRVLFALITLIALCYGLWHFYESKPEVHAKVHELFNTGSFNTLEVRYSAAQIMERERRNLLKDNRHRYLDPTIQFYPYLLMEVKYAVSEKKTKEGLILWDLTDGEMVVSTKGWNKTHGFGDCIIAHVDRYEFRILEALAAKGGRLDRSHLQKALHLENEHLDKWLELCRQKQLIVQVGNQYRLHLEKPLLSVSPSTQIEERLVTKAHRNTERVPPHFSLAQIEQMAKSAFGSEFAIRKTATLYLPVHAITVQNTDGSVHTSHWNALNGKRLHTSSLL